MRGKAAPGVQGQSPCGITPAYAGKSFCDVPCNISIGDHPRVCGEKAFAAHRPMDFQGSPPRVRGKGLRPFRACGSCRITPAYAGKRKSRRCCTTIGLGSPPRMRGKGADIVNGFVSAGITPAYAGKSQSYRQPCSAMWDHPRVCGEKQIPQTYISLSRGSPPRMRGKDLDDAIVQLNNGITPAYAGKSPDSS